MPPFGPEQVAIVLFVVVAYILGTTALTLWTRSTVHSGDQFMTAGRSLSPFLTGVLMMSEFIGTSATVGTAQQAFTSGMAAAWGYITFLIAFPLFGWVLAPKFHETGEYTISGVIAKKYGRTTQLVTSLIMIYSLFTVNVATYVGGSAAVATVLKVSLPIGALITAAVTTLYVLSGGLRSVAYVNVIHALVKFLGVGIAALMGWRLSGGLVNLKSNLPPYYFTALGKVGLSTIIAWTVANIGAVFSTQMIIQAISGVKSPSDARKATYYAGVLAAPMGILAALAGVEARHLFPEINSVMALPVYIRAINPWLGGIVTIAIIAAVFANVAAVSLAITALLIKDFYVPYARPSERKKIAVTRLISVLVGLLPIPFVLFVPSVLKTMFFARALRTSIAVVAVMAFYLPRISGDLGASLGLIAAAVGASVWFFLDDPLGIDNTYVAAAIPAIVMAVDHLIRRRKPSAQAEPAHGEAAMG